VVRLEEGLTAGTGSARHESHWRLPQVLLGKRKWAQLVFIYSVGQRWEGALAVEPGYWRSIWSWSCVRRDLKARRRTVPSRSSLSTANQFRINLRLGII